MRHQCFLRPAGQTAPSWDCEPGLNVRAVNDAFLQFQALLPAEIRHHPRLRELSLRQHDLPPQTTVYNAGTAPSRIYFVAKGWVADSFTLTSRMRPYSAVRIRSDVAGLASLNGQNAVEDVTTITGAELISVPSADLASLMREDRQILDFVFAEMVRNLATLQLMNAIIGRLKAPERLAYFLYIMLRRARRTFHGQLDTLTLPLTQEQIGQLLGLTNVSVNRAFRALESEQLIRTGRQAVTFLDEARFARRLEFDAREDLILQLVGS